MRLKFGGGVPGGGVSVVRGRRGPGGGVSVVRGRRGTRGRSQCGQGEEGDQGEESVWSGEGGGQGEPGEGLTGCNMECLSQSLLCASHLGALGIITRKW